MALWYTMARPLLTYENPMSKIAIIEMSHIQASLVQSNENIGNTVHVMSSTTWPNNNVSCLVVNCAPIVGNFPTPCVDIFGQIDGTQQRHTCTWVHKISLSSPSCLMSIAFLNVALLWSRDRHSCAGKNSRLFGCMKWQVSMTVTEPGGWSPCPQGYLVIWGGWTNTGVGKGMLARLTHRSFNLQKTACISNGYVTWWYQYVAGSSWASSHEQHTWGMHLRHVHRSRSVQQPSRFGAPDHQETPLLCGPPTRRRHDSQFGEQMGNSVCIAIVATQNVTDTQHHFTAWHCCQFILVKSYTRLGCNMWR